MVQPLRDYVLLEKVPDEKKVGKIILATANENESALATVVAVGPVSAGLGSVADFAAVVAVAAASPSLSPSYTACRYL